MAAPGRASMSEDTGLLHITRRPGLKGPRKTLQNISDPYFVFIRLIFYSYLCLQLWKYNPSTFLTTIYKKGHKMEILLHQSIYTDFFFSHVHFPLSVYVLFLLQWYSHLLSLSLTFILAPLPLQPSLALLDKYNEYFYDPYFKY